MVPMTTKAKERSIKLLSWDADRRAGVLQITEGGKVDLYHVARTDSDFGNAFEVDKVEMDSSVGDYVSIANYDVLIDGRRSTCDCLGFSRFGYCRHIQGLAVLIAKGRI
jgi:hypothetical protein